MFSRSPRWSTPALAATALLAAIAGGFVGRTFLGPQTAEAFSKPRAGTGAAATAMPLPDLGRDDRVSTEELPALSSSAGTTDAETRWKRLAREPASPRREREMTDTLKSLAATDPTRALALASAEPNLRLRETLLQAVLEGWATRKPDDAVAWAMNLAEDRRRQAIEAVFAGAARDPEAVIRLGTRLSAQEPALTGDYGNSVVNALAQTGAFDAAVRFASSVSAEHRGQLLSSAFHAWAQHRPEQALEALKALPDANARVEAQQGLLSGWAYTQPAALANHAMQLPAGEERARALREALPQWVARDPVATLQWLDKFDPAPDFDAGVAAVASLHTLVSKSPAVALSWAESIFDPALRHDTIRNVVEQWARSDQTAARRYVENLQDVSADQRTQMLEAINPSRR